MVWFIHLPEHQAAMALDVLCNDPKEFTLEHNTSIAFLEGIYKSSDQQFIVMRALICNLTAYTHPHIDNHKRPKDNVNSYG